METNALPKYPDYIHPTLVALKKKGGSATIEEIEDAVAEIMKLSEEALAIPHGDTGQTEFQYKLAWVRTYLKKYGALDNSERAVWTITEKGEKVTEDEARKVFKVIQAAQRNKRNVLNNQAPEEAPVETSWVENCLAALGKMEPAAFERLSQRLLRESGFIKVEVTGKPSDGGIDGIGVLRMNLVSFQVLFQCKRYKGSVSASVVRDFRGAMVGRADKGLIITTGSFTAEARKEATRDGAPAIDLLDGEALCNLLKERRLGVSVKLVEEVYIDEQFFLGI